MIYGNSVLFESTSSNSSEIIMTESERERILNFLLSESYFDYVDEGANLDITSKYTKFISSFKANIKKAKTAQKSGNYKEAAKYIADGKKDIAEIRKALKNMDSDAGSVIFGFFAGGLVECIKVFIPIVIYGTGVSIASIFSVKAMKEMESVISVSELTKMFSDAMGSMETSSAGSLVGSGVGMSVGGALATAGMIATIVSQLIILVKNITEMINEVKAGEKTENVINRYRLNLITATDKFEKQLDSVEAKLKAKK